MACPILATFLFTISFSAFFYSLDVFSHCHRLFKQYKIKNIWSPLGIEPRTACITHKRSATELWQPASKQTLQFCIYPAKGYCYATVSLSTDQRKFSFFKDSYYSLNFFTPLLLLHSLFLSLLLLIRCIAVKSGRKCKTLNVKFKIAHKVKKTHWDNRINIWNNWEKCLIKFL